MSAQLPEALHRLKGSRPTRAAAPTDSKVSGGRPRMPKYFDDDEKECWREIVRVLVARGTLSPGDAPNIGLYAETKARHLRLMRELKQDGEMIDTVILDSSGNPHTKRILNPAGKSATQLANSLRALLKELCATIASRERAKQAAPARPKKDEYPVGSMGWLLQQKAAGLLGGNRENIPESLPDEPNGDENDDGQ